MMTNTAEKPKVSLLDLTVRLDRLGEMVEELDGELTPELEELLDNLLVQDREKVAGIGWMLKGWDADAKAITEYMIGLREKVTILKNKRKRLLTYIKYVMDLRGVTELFGTPWNLVIRRNGGADPIKLKDGIVAENLPKKFQRVTVTEDKDALREALMAPAGSAALRAAKKVAYIAERGSSVRVS